MRSAASRPAARSGDFYTDTIVAQARPRYPDQATTLEQSVRSSSDPRGEHERSQA
jgi:hypothetical protein